jgi:hypothetical protein
MLFPVIFLVPIGMIQAVTNWQIGTNVITEFVYGYMQAGRPLGAMMFKCYVSSGIHRFPDDHLTFTRVTSPWLKHCISFRISRWVTI